MKNMDVKTAYNAWSDIYDDNANKTRDLEAVALRRLLADAAFETCLEMGCGTGKNTQWLKGKAGFLLSTDLSEGMLEKARAKISDNHVHFLQTDMNTDWHWVDDLGVKNGFDLVVFSLVLEHIDDLEAVFRKVAAITHAGSRVYVGELHPFKQYSGTKARFDTEQGRHEVTCFNHHVSDFLEAAQAAGFGAEVIKEYFDDDDRSAIPRILAMIFRKN